MAETNLLKRFLDAGAAFTQMTQARAEEIVKDLVSAGEVQTNQAQAAVSDLIERSRENTERLIEQVRNDIRAQVGNLGLATKADITRLERQIAQLKSAGRAGAKKTATRTPAKNTATRTPAKKTATRSPAKKAAKKR